MITSKKKYIAHPRPTVRFAQVVLASQALALSTTFAGVGLAAEAATPAAPYKVSGTSLISLEFSEAKVSVILSMIAREGNIDIVIGEDVTGIIQNLRLTDKTPEQALKIVTQSAGLSFSKVDSRTYMVRKKIFSLNNVGRAEELEDDAGLQEGQSSTAEIPELQVASRAFTPEKSTTSIAIRNVKPRVMAYWLDPSHQPVPAEFVQSDERERLQGKPYIGKRSTTANDWDESKSSNNAVSAQTPQWTQPGSGYLPFNPYTTSNRQFGGTGGAGGAGGAGTSGQQLLAPGAGTVALPEGVDNLIAIDAQNVLLVRGTDEGIDRIREIIALLDKPIAQVEIEAKFVTVETTASDIFDLRLTNIPQTDDDDEETPVLPGGTSFRTTAAAGVGGIGVAYTRGNFQASLNAAVSSGRARVVQSPRVTTFNNLTAQILQSRTQTIVTTETIFFPPTNGSPGSTQEVPRYTDVSSAIVLTVIPTVNGDGTITLNLQPLIQAATPSSSSPFPDILSQTINTSANVKDGDTLAIGGLRQGLQSDRTGRIPVLGSLPLIGKLFRSKEKVNQDTELLIFVTARIIRRTDDPVPGT